MKCLEILSSLVLKVTKSLYMMAKADILRKETVDQASAENHEFLVLKNMQLEDLKQVHLQIITTQLLKNLCL